MTYRVLFVCTGNICRSPTADGVLRHKLEEEGLHRQVEVDSVGVHGYHVGEPPDSRSIAAAARRGYNLHDLRARKLHKRDFEEFDLILAMDEGHYSALLSSKPKGAKASIRMYLEFADGFSEIEVPDPWYGDADGFELVLDMVEDATEGLLAHIRQTAA